MSRNESPEKTTVQKIIEKFNIADFSALKAELTEAIANIENTTLREVAQKKLNSVNVERVMGQLDLITLSCVLAEKKLIPNNVQLKEPGDCNENDFLKINAPVYYFPLRHDLNEAEKGLQRTIETLEPPTSFADQAAQAVQTVVTNVAYYADRAVQSVVEVASTAAQTCDKAIYDRVRSYLFPRREKDWQRLINDREYAPTEESPRSPTPQ